MSGCVTNAHAVFNLSTQPSTKTKNKNSILKASISGFGKNSCLYNSLFSHVSGNPRYLVLGSLTTGAVFRVFVTYIAIDRDWTYPGIRFIRDQVYPAPTDTSSTCFSRQGRFCDRRDLSLLGGNVDSVRDGIRNQIKLRLLGYNPKQMEYDGESRCELGREAVGKGRCNCSTRFRHTMYNVYRNCITQ